MVMSEEEFVTELPAVSCLITINVSKVRMVVGSHIGIRIFEETHFPQTEENATCSSS